MFKDKILLLTGATGSFGQAFVERLLKTDLKEIRCFSRNEKLQVDMRRKFDDSRLTFVIGDVRDKYAIDKAIKGVNYVIHASALKHIDICEKQSIEAVKTNVFGSMNVILSSIENKVEKLVCLSTDKAANAESCYGSTKYLMEKMCTGIDSENTKIVITRYGNVIGSSGSVIPFFKKLASEGKPLTVTSREITRFFMPIEQSVELVMYALENGNDKDLFVCKNKGATVGAIADCISDNQVIIGTRGNEKTSEALLTIAELNHSEDLGDYYRVNDNIVNPIKHTEPFTSDNCEKFTNEELKRFIWGEDNENSSSDNDVRSLPRYMETFF